jgi:hypothetical protein
VNRHIPLLAVLLAIQLAIVGGVLFWQQQGAAGESRLWFEPEASAIDRILIEDGRGASVTLVRSEDRWRVQRSGSNGQAQTYPADESRVASVLERVAGAEARWPVATSPAAARRFEVADANFQRRIGLYANEATLAQFYLGSSPGFRRVHARRADADGIYAIEFGVHDAPAEVDEWLDKALLRHIGRISRVDAHVVMDGSIVAGTDEQVGTAQSDAWALVRDDVLWQLQDLAPGERTLQIEVEDWVRRFGSLRVLGIGDAGAIEGQSPVMTFIVTDEDGPKSYRFFRPGDEGEYLVTASHQVGVFRAAEFQVGQLRRGRDALTARDAATPDDGA